MTHQPEKKCSECGEQKALTEYTVDTSASDGRVHACKSCMKLRRQRYAAQTNEERQAKLDRRRLPRKKGDFKRCRRCDRVQPVEEYHYSPMTRDALVSRCKSCERERYQERKARNLARRRAEQSHDQRGAS